MALLFIILAMVVMVILVLLLPQMSGLTKVEYKANRHRDEPQEKQDDEYEGYVPPDELQRRLKSQQSSKLSLNSLKKKMVYHKEDAPLKVHLKREDVGRLRRRLKKADIQEQNDPNAFDFDIDELILEEQQDQQKEQEREFQSRSAKSNEALEEMA
jgi:hypothetical protein